MSIEDTQQAIVEEFARFDDWRARYKHIIELGRQVPDLADEHKVDVNLIKGCQNRVWLHAELRDGKVHFEAASEASIVQGLVALVLRVFSGHEPDEILSAQPHFIEDLKLGENLTMNRANGLASMIKKMKMYALVFKSVAQRQE